MKTRILGTICLLALAACENGIGSDSLGSSPSSWFNGVFGGSAASSDQVITEMDGASAVDSAAEGADAGS